ncbi:alpha-amylase family glycosyl hydrolase [Bradyrhizobium sp. USDA 4454]
MRLERQTDARWWQCGVIYQIYPRSFHDMNGDGVGDLAGLIHRLPYLAELGVDAIWLSPIFRSPMADFGYDISDYKTIDPLFGTLEDCDRLVEAAHAQGLKVILDLVPNHTSDQHPWFTESRAGRANPKRDWYIWRDGAPDGGAPNNWLSDFGGSAWQYDPASDQYYYHAFLASQPDLNWRNAEVRAAIYDVMRFWLARGIDGFRVDVIWHLIKDDQFRDNPVNPAFGPGSPPHNAVIPLYTADRPEVHDVIAEMRGVIDEFAGRLLIGEIYLPIEKLVAYYGRDLSGVHLPFNFALLSAPWEANSLAKLIADYEAALPSGGWPNWVLGNHDRPRIAGRIGPRQARLGAMLLLTLRGTPTIYYGDEIGLEQVNIPLDRLHDPVATNMPGHALGRDGCRTPMQWDESAYAGFSAVEPWLPLSDDWRERNAAEQKRDKSSIYWLYRRLIELRRSNQVLLQGSYRTILARGDLLLFIREYSGHRLLVALNLGNDPASLNFEEGTLRGRLMLSSSLDREDEDVDGRLDLRDAEGVIISLSQDGEV